MVRLRSDRWYSRSGQRRVRMQQKPVGGGLRRVFSLAVLLILVVWVMQRSAEPEAYERIFRYLGVPLAPNESKSQNAQAFSVSALSKPSLLREGAANSLQATQSLYGVWDNLSWTSKDLEYASQFAFVSDANPKLKVAEPLVAEPQQTEPQAAELKPAEGSVPESPMPLELSQLPWSQPDIQLTVQIALADHRLEFSQWLDQRLLSQLTDGSPWRSTETDVFYRLLQRAVEWDRGEANQMSVISYPALKESITLSRGKEWVRFRGWIEQAKFIQSKEKKFGIQSYWTLWLRPSDQTARPVVAYLTRLPPSLEGKPVSDLKGEIEVFGLPAKLMAYNAVGGVEVAPTLCGVASDYFVKAAAVVDSAKAVKGSNYDWLWPVLLAGLFSAVWVAWIWRSSQTVTVEDASTSQAGTKKLKFVMGGNKGTDGNKSNASILLLAFSLSCSTVATTSAHFETNDAQEKTAVDPAEEEVKKAAQLLATRLTDETLFEIRHYAANEPNGLNLFPNSLGRLLYTVGQIGDERLKLLVTNNAHNSTWKVESWQGWVVGCDVVSLAEQQAEWMGQKEVYRLQVELTKGPDRSVGPETPVKSNLFVTQAPSQWLQQSDLHQPFQATVIDLSDHDLSQLRSEVKEDSARGETDALFGRIGVAASLHWALNGSGDLALMRPAIPSAWQRLALLGADLTWIDLARIRQKLDLTVADRNSFYQLLKIGSKVDSTELNKQFGPVDWTAINGPELLAREQNQWVGRTISAKGRISRISRVPIENKTSRELAESDFYYQMDGFIRIEGKRIVIPPPQAAREEGTNVGRTEDLVYENEFPMTVVALKLPDFLKEGEFDEGGVQHQSWNSQKWVDVQGVFFRNWSYRSEYVSRGNSQERQMAPLIVATTIKTTMMTSEATTSPGNWVNWLAMFLIFGLLALIWGYVVADSKAKRTNRYKKNAKP